MEERVMTEQRTGGTATREALPTLPHLGAAEREQLLRRQLGAREARVSNRFLCVRQADINRGWTMAVLAENLGIPEQACVAYITAYIADGLDGLGREAPGGEAFYSN
jgi:hypothetical protein